MNKERMHMVADAIRKEQFNLTFDMGEWCELPPLLQMERDTNDNQIEESKIYNSKKKEYACGTSACVAGFTVAIFKPVIFRSKLTSYDGAISTQAQKILELTDVEADDLFYGRGPGMDKINDLHRKDVPAALDWMAENNTVDWPKALMSVGAIGMDAYNYYTFGYKDS